MKMRDWEKVIDFENLYQGHLNVRKGRAYKTETVNFGNQLAYHLATLQDALINGTYKMRPYFHFEVYEPKRRDIYAAYHLDKILNNVICEQILIPRLAPHFIFDNVACQKGRGVHVGLRRFKAFLVEHYRAHGKGGYVLKCDISQYFASIRHDVLLEMVKKRIKDPDVVRLLAHIIGTYHTVGKPGVGLPLGNNTSQWFALYYLSEFDHYVKEVLGIRGYIRYMDDFVLVSHSKQHLWECLERITELLADLGLSINPKSSVYPISAGVEWLGWRFFVTDRGKVLMRLRLQSKKRLKKKVKRMRYAFQAGKLDLPKVKHVLASHHGHLIHGDAYRLERQMLEGMTM